MSQSKSTTPIWKAAGNFLIMGRILLGNHPEEFSALFMDNNGVIPKNAQQIAADYYRETFLGSEEELCTLEQAWNVDKYNIYLISIPEEQELSSLTIPDDELPTLIKKGNSVYVYGRNVDCVIGYSSAISLEKFPSLHFPQIHSETTVLLKEAMPISFYQMLTHSGHHFDVMQKFGLYMQGEISGKAISDTFFNYLINRINFTSQPRVIKFGHINFGYINDKGEVCGFSLIYDQDRPELWAIGIMENANNHDPKLRKQVLIYSGNLDVALTQALPELGNDFPYSEVLNKSNFTRVTNMQHEITSNIGSKKMVPLLVNIINPIDGKVNIELVTQIFGSIRGSSGRYNFYEDLLRHAISEEKWVRIIPVLREKLVQYTTSLEAFLQKDDDNEYDNQLLDKKLRTLETLINLCSINDNGVAFFQYFFESCQFSLQEQDAKKRIGNFILEILSWLTLPIGGIFIYKATTGFWPRLLPSIHDRDYNLANKTDKELLQILTQELTL